MKYTQSKRKVRSKYWKFSVKTLAEHRLPHMSEHVYLNMYVWKHRLCSRQLSSSNMQQAFLSELAARCLHSGLYNAINDLNMLKKPLDFVPLDWESFSPRSLRAHLPHTSSMLWGRCHNRSMCGRRREASPQLTEHSIPFLVLDPSASLYARLPQCLAVASKRLSEESGGTRTSSSTWRCVCSRVDWKRSPSPAAHFSNERPKICLVYSQFHSTSIL